MKPMMWLTLAVVAVGAGCSADSNTDSNTDDSEEAVTEQQPAAVQPQEPAADEPSGGDFDYDEFLDVLQSATGLDDPPETRLVRLIRPEEQPDVWRECMHEAGFEVTTTFDGGLSAPAELPDEQWDAYELANYTCHAQFPVDQTLHQQFGEQQVEIVYTYYTEQLVHCLEERGFTVEPAPTYETFRASWSDGGEGLHATDESWFPYGSVDVDTFTYDEWEELNLACPQNPSNEVLFAEED